MELSIKNNKPIVFIKVQTTGLKSEEDRIVELALVKFEKEKTPVKVVRRFNPGIDIPEESSKYSGITDKDVQDEPSFEEKAGGILGFIEGCDFIGFNIRNFDIPFLSAEFVRSGENFSTYGRKFIDLKSFYQRIEARNFKNAVKRFIGLDIEDQISSEDFLKHSINLFNSMLDNSENQELETGEVVISDFNTLSQLFDPYYGSLDVDGKIVLNKDRRPVFSFGKHKNKLLADVFLKEDQGYFNWIVDVSDFSHDTKNVVKEIYKKAKKHAEQMA